MDNRWHDVIIIGAGPAGLACASRLQDHGIDCVILEASNRVGGRAYTNYDFADGLPLEQGALMIHGRHVVTQSWVRELGLHARRFRTTQRAVFSISRRLAFSPYLVLPFHPVFGSRAFYEGAYRIPRLLRDYRGPDLSFGRFLEQSGASPGGRSFASLLHCHTYAADPDQLGVLGPAQEDGRASEEFGYNNYQVVEGYSELMRRKAATLRVPILFRRRVTDVRRKEARVEVHTIDPHTGGLIGFRGRAAVVTVSLGVLKAGDIVFDPPLPDEKRRAIEALAFGQAITVHLRFRSDSVPSRVRKAVLLWGETPSSFLRLGRPSDGRHTYLSAFTTGREAMRRAGTTDSEILTATIEELQSILPEGMRLGPAECCGVQRWPLEPFTRGAYSFLGVGNPLSLRSTLGEPVDQMLFFAGEATNDHGESATVHGAIETGYRAAKQVIRRLGTFPSSAQRGRGPSEAMPRSAVPPP